MGGSAEEGASPPRKEAIVKEKTFFQKFFQKLHVCVQLFPSSGVRVKEGFTMNQMTNLEKLPATIDPAVAAAMLVPERLNNHSLHAEAVQNASSAFERGSLPTARGSRGRSSRTSSTSSSREHSVFSIRGSAGLPPRIPQILYFRNQYR